MIANNNKSTKTQRTIAAMAKPGMVEASEDVVNVVLGSPRAAATMGAGLQEGIPQHMPLAGSATDTTGSMPGWQAKDGQSTPMLETGRVSLQVPGGKKLKFEHGQCCSVWPFSQVTVICPYSEPRVAPQHSASEEAIN